MAFVTKLRDWTANSHLHLATRYGKQVTILDQNGIPVTGWSNLYAIARNLTIEETEKFGGSYPAIADKVFEIARQGSFQGTTVQLQFHKILYGTTTYEIVSVQADDQETITVAFNYSIANFVGAATWSGGVATLTFTGTPNPALAIGQNISVQGVNNAGYVVASVAISGVSGSTISYSLPVNPGGNSFGGTVSTLPIAGKEDGAVFTYYCKKMVYGRGEMAM